MILKTKKRGFTLIELLVVIAIISMLASIVLASLKSVRDKANIVAINKTAEAYHNALIAYSLDHGAFPVLETANGSYCMSDYPDNKCWLSGSFTSSTLLRNAISPYVSSLKPPPPSGLVLYGNPIPPDLFYSYRNPPDRCVGNVCRVGVMAWYMPVTPQKCGGFVTPAISDFEANFWGYYMCKIDYFNNLDYAPGSGFLTI